jgi:phosphoribosylaminoimidazole-succinocarboxamide synthase
MVAALLQSECPDLRLLARGKVRDVYEVDEDSLLFVATDRISAFDVVMSTAIPGKGKILTQLSLFWFDLLKDVSANHLITAAIDDMPARVQQYRDQLEDRCMLVRRLEILPIEAIIRGYLSGSGWKEYQKAVTVCGIALPAGLQESAELPTPLFTPSTKAEQGDHDENIHPDQAVQIIGAERVASVSATAIELYSTARAAAKAQGIIIADTKFEFGVDAAGTIVLADEVLTPDSSRFWPASDYAVGRGQDSFDKQYVRDYLESIQFDKQTPVALPDDIVAQTAEKYIQAFQILTGHAPRL